MNKRLMFGIVLVVIGIIILASAALFYFSGAKKDEENQKITKEPSLEITELKLCNSIDDSFNCEENVNGEFETIGFIDVLIKINDLKSKKINNENKIIYAQSREIIGPDREIIESSTLFSDEEEAVPKEGLYSIKIKNRIVILSNAKSGRYVLKIMVIDKNTGKGVTKSKEFIIK